MPPDGQRASLRKRGLDLVHTGGVNDQDHANAHVESLERLVLGRSAASIRIFVMAGTAHASLSTWAFMRFRKRAVEVFGNTATRDVRKRSIAWRFAKQLSTCFT